jgi:hypothetical protein
VKKGIRRSPIKGITGYVPTLIARIDALGVRTVLNNYNATG